jgi:hypothetical protein
MSRRKYRVELLQVLAQEAGKAAPGRCHIYANRLCRLYAASTTTGEFVSRREAGNLLRMLEDHGILKRDTGALNRKEYVLEPEKLPELRKMLEEVAE